MRTIGKYEVVEKIGEGGFGTIFKGFDPHIRRFVAIKSCTSEEENLRSRFLNEAQIAGNLQHRHVVTVCDFGLQDGVPYLVQEYLSGEDLDRKIKRQEFIPLAEKLLYEGTTVDVENPLPAPGRLEVQQKLGTPPGRVSLDGEELGAGRVRRTLTPGPHRLRIEPSSAGGGNAIDREMTVPSGRKLVLTFDLTTGGLVEVVAPFD